MGFNHVLNDIPLSGEFLNISQEAETMGKLYFWRLLTDSRNGKKSIYTKAVRKAGPAGPWGSLDVG